MLPLYLARIPNVFHVLSLRKAKIDLTLLLPQVLIKINEYLMIKVKPLSILDRSGKELRNKKVATIKNKNEEETWERVLVTRKMYPELFSNINMNLNFKNFYRKGKERM